MINFDLEFKDLESFVALYNYQNYTKAAEKLYITQSALSRRIRDLEEELGMELVDRSSSRIRITEAGKQMYKECLRLMKEKDALYTRMNRFRSGETGAIRIGADPTYDLNMVLKGITELSRDYPSVQINFECNHDLNLLRYLQEGTIDVAYTHRGEVEGIPGIKSVAIGKNRLTVGVGRQHRFFDRSNISWEELNGEGIVSPRSSTLEKVMDRGKSAGVSFRECVITKSVAEIFGHVSTGKYICFWGDYSSHIILPSSEYIRFIPVIEGENQLGWPVIAFLTQNSNPVIEKLLSVYRE